MGGTEEEADGEGGPKVYKGKVERKPQASEGDNVSTMGVADAS